MTIVLDTATLLYFTFFPQELSATAQQTIQSAEKLVISSISIWEVGVKVQKGKLMIPLAVKEFAAKLEELERLEIVPVTSEVWLANLALAWSHRDPADRTIVATALLLSAPLVTPDREIQGFYTSVVW